MPITRICYIRFWPKSRKIGRIRTALCLNNSACPGYQRGRVCGAEAGHIGGFQSGYRWRNHLCVSGPVLAEYEDVCAAPVWASARERSRSTENRFAKPPRLSTSTRGVTGAHDPEDNISKQTMRRYADAGANLIRREASRSPNKLRDKIVHEDRKNQRPPSGL